MKQENNSQARVTAIVVAAFFILAIVVVSLFVARSMRDDSSNLDGGGNNNSQGSDNNNGGGSTAGPGLEILQLVRGQALLDFLANKESGFLYVGRETCPVCQEFAPILVSVVDEEGLGVMYFDTDLDRETQERITVLETLQVDSVPTMLYIKDGQIAETLVGLTGREGLLEFFNRHR